MKPPHRKNHKATAAYFNDLLQRIGKPQLWIANRTGISHRRMQYLINGERTQGGKTEPVLMTYPEQYILESLADSILQGEPSP